MGTIGQKNRIAGYVVDGGIRDAQAIKEMDFPVFAKGVNPADLIVGDDDGVVVVPYE